MHAIAILALDGVVPFDLATPCEVFGRIRLPDGRPAYDVRVCSVNKEVDAGAFRMLPPWTGTTPLQYLLAARVRRGQHLLETTNESVEQIASRIGFGSVTTFRTCFQRIAGTSPRAYRGAFRASA